MRPNPLATVVAICAVVTGVALTPPVLRASARGVELPSRLSDQEFWRIASDSSEPNGYFRSVNLTSNELRYQDVIPDLVSRTKPGGAYLGVGPEQNFTYMAAVRPRLAIIFDIRRGNLLLQLMYKAVFELSNDRAAFLSMLFSKPRPPGLGATSTVADLFARFEGSPASDALHTENLKAIEDDLTQRHGLPLTAEDLGGIEYVSQAFYRSGFAVRPSPSYADLMTATDASGESRSYLATEDRFAFLKDLESRNLVIPVVGDFGGPKAIRAIGAYLRTKGATVAAFYLSNVEQYLYQDGKWPAFCHSVATLPLDASSTFIRSSSGRAAFGRGFVSSLGAMATEVATCGS
jgi:hypothetical protein